MGKRVDNDSTMEMSTSQLVPERVDHDASVWGQKIVGTEQFAPAPVKRDRKAMWVALVFIVFTAVAAAVVIALV